MSEKAFKMQVFRSEQFGDVRYLLDEGKVWFSVRHICLGLGFHVYGGSSLDVITKKADCKLPRMYKTDGDLRAAYYINVDDLQKIAKISKRADAAEFCKWLTSEAQKIEGGKVTQEVAQDNGERWYTTQEIADAIGLSYYTTSKIIKNVLQRFNFNIKTERKMTHISGKDKWGYEYSQKVFQAVLSRAVISTPNNVSNKDAYAKSKVATVAAVTRESDFKVFMQYLQAQEKRQDARDAQVMSMMQAVMELLKDKQQPLAIESEELKAERAKNEQLAIKLDESTNWATIRKAESVIGLDVLKGKVPLFRGYWSYEQCLEKELSDLSEKLGHEIMDVNDTKYGAINAYHIDVWRAVFGDDIANALKAAGN